MISFTDAGTVGPRARAPDSARGAFATEVAPLRVRESSYRYEDEGSEARSLGSVSLGPGAWWSGALSVPGREGEARETVLVRVERHGARPASEAGINEVELLLPVGEVDAVVTLLSGMVAQARRDGVLPAPPP